MLNPISNAVREIHSVIPPQILTIVFGQEDFRQWRRPAPVSIDEMIKSKIIRPRLLKDFNLIGGRMMVIPLIDLPCQQIDDVSQVYNIPAERTGGREIMSVLSVGYISESIAGIPMGTPFGVSAPNSVSDFETVGERVMDAASTIPHVSSATVELIGYNMVVLSDSMRPTTGYSLRCIIANDDQLSNISPRSYMHIAKAAALATKSWIYNNWTIRIEQGILEQGQNVARFKEIIDKYEDAEEQYQEYLKTIMRKVFFMSDMNSYRRYISAQFNPGV